MNRDEAMDRFRDELYEEQPPPPTCGLCNLCRTPDAGFSTDPNIGFCLESREFVHLDWEVDGECDSFVEN